MTSAFDRNTRDREGEDESAAGEPALPAAKAAEKSGGFGRWLLELVSLVAMAFALSLVIRTFVVQPFVVPSPSLDPTIRVGDRVLVNKFIYRFTTPHRGDIVVFADPNHQLPALIKRVVAVGGDRVDIHDGRLVLNGQALEEPYVHGKPTEPGTVRMPVTIPQGYVFLMGDNRPNSGDARYFGPQPISVIEGRAFAIYWPFEEIHVL
jgi:signal peptidase I